MVILLERPEYERDIHRKKSVMAFVHQHHYLALRMACRHRADIY